jgi:hypothetical protein
LPLAILWIGSELPLRQGLQRKAHRKRIGASEDLQRKARFLALCAKKAPKFRITNGFLDRFLEKRAWEEFYGFRITAE